MMYVVQFHQGGVCGEVRLQCQAQGLLGACTALISTPPLLLSPPSPPPLPGHIALSPGSSRSSGASSPGGGEGEERGHRGRGGQGGRGVEGASPEGRAEGSGCRGAGG